MQPSAGPILPNPIAVPLKAVLSYMHRFTLKGHPRQMGLETLNSAEVFSLCLGAIAVPPVSTSHTITRLLAHPG